MSRSQNLEYSPKGLFRVESNRISRGEGLGTATCIMMMMMITVFPAGCVLTELENNFLCGTNRSLFFRNSEAKHNQDRTRLISHSNTVQRKKRSRSIIRRIRIDIHEQRQTGGVLFG